MKSILLFWSVFTLHGLFAQNYQTIHSAQQNYFGQSDLSYVLATRTDSIEFVEGDSIFHSYRTARFVDADSCLLYKDAAWTGEKIIIEPDGRNVFFNNEMDSIFIQTNAALNDTFLVYNYPAGEFIKGTVTAITEESVLGMIDSVKTIELFSNSADFTHADPVFKLSKNHGFIKLIPFYSFPNNYSPIHHTDFDKFELPLELVGTEYPRQGFTKRTVGEVYNQEIGDKINYIEHITHYSTTTLFTNLVQINVIDKEIWGVDSVEYTYNLIKEARSINEFGSIETTMSSETYTKKIYDLDNLFYTYLPEEFIFESYEGATNYEGELEYCKLSMSDCGLIQESICMLGTLYPGTDFEGDTTSNCFNYSDVGYDFIFKSYWENAGGDYFKEGNSLFGYGVDYDGSLEFTRYSGIECGTEFFVDLPEPLVVVLSVYPNPVKQGNELTIVAPNYIENVELLTLKGQIVPISQRVYKERVVLEMQNIPSGIYIVKVWSNGETIQRKVAVY